MQYLVYVVQRATSHLQNKEKTTTKQKSIRLKLTPSSSQPQTNHLHINYMVSFTIQMYVHNSAKGEQLPLRHIDACVIVTESGWTFAKYVTNSNM